MSAKSKIIETDVVVVGAAFAGLAATLEAVSAGAGVIVLGRQGIFANSSSLGGGAFAMVDTPMQREKGIKDSVDLLKQDILRTSNHTVDPELAETRVDVHQGRKGTGEPAPDAATEVPVEPHPDDSRQKQVYEPGIVQEREREGEPAPVHTASHQDSHVGCVRPVIPRQGPAGDP